MLPTVRQQHTLSCFIAAIKVNDYNCVKEVSITTGVKIRI